MVNVLLLFEKNVNKQLENINKELNFGILWSDLKIGVIVIEILN